MSRIFFETGNKRSFYFRFTGDLTARISEKYQLSSQQIFLSFNFYNKLLPCLEEKVGDCLIWDSSVNLHILKDTDDFQFSTFIVG